MRKFLYFFTVLSFILTASAFMWNGDAEAAARAGRDCKKQHCRKNKPFTTFKSRALCRDICDYRKWKKWKSRASKKLKEKCEQLDARVTPKTNRNKKNAIVKICTKKGKTGEYYGDIPNSLPQIRITQGGTSGSTTGTGTGGTETGGTETGGGSGGISQGCGTCPANKTCNYSTRQCYWNWCEQPGTTGASRHPNCSCNATGYTGTYPNCTCAGGYISDNQGGCKLKACADINCSANQICKIITGTAQCVNKACSDYNLPGTYPNCNCSTEERTFVNNQCKYKTCTQAMSDGTLSCEPYKMCAGGVTTAPICVINPNWTGDYIGANLTAVNFNNMNLSGKNFSGATLTNASCSNANFTGAIFDNAKFTNVHCPNSIFNNASFKNVIFKKSRLYSGSFINANLSNARFEFLYASDESLFGNSNFTNANLTNVYVKNTGQYYHYALTTHGSNFTDANFSGSTSIPLHRATNYTRTNFSGRHIALPSYNAGSVNPTYIGTNFSNTRFFRSVYDFTSTVLNNANFAGSNLGNVNFQNVVWETSPGSGVLDITGLTRAQLCSAKKRTCGPYE